MKIALIGPLSIAIPPRLYGGTESVVGILADGLVEAGHDVTLFASADSTTKAKLVPTWPTSLADDPDGDDPTGRFIYTSSHIAGQVADRLVEFDLIHNHIDENALILSKFTTAPFVTTMHRKLDREFQRRLYRYYNNVHYVSLSDSQRATMPELNWLARIYNGVDIDQIACNDTPDDYLLFVGRLSPEKDPVAAIKLAQATGHRLLIAAKVDAADRWYFDQRIKPLLRDYPKAEYLGEVDDAAKAKLYQGALATLFPIDWEEPFGLVMVESLAAGTPIIATRRGSVPEVIEDGVSGYICDDFAGMVAAIKKVDGLSRRACRLRAEGFSSARMVKEYLGVYSQLLKRSA